MLNGKANVHKFAVKIGLTVCAMLLLASCGRTIPTISESQLKEKKALLVVTAASIPAADRKTIQASVQKTAALEQTAVTFFDHKEAITSDISARIENEPYDFVLVAGDELFSAALNEAKKNKEKRFILLHTTPAPQQVVYHLSENAPLKTLQNKAFTNAWGDWVHLQNRSGLPILWLAKSSNPVPSDWAPSEEADSLLYLDFYPDSSWFQQMKFQAEKIQAKWIGVYTPIDPALLPSIQSLHLPIVDLRGGMKVSYRWDQIIPSLLQQAKENRLPSGMTYYTGEETTVTRK